MRCRYEFFLVSPNSSYEDDWDDDDFEREYECKFTTDNRQCIRISGRQTDKSEYKLSVNGTDTFYGTNVGLHMSSVYGLPVIPTQAPKPEPIQVLNIMEDVLGLKPKPYFDSYDTMTKLRDHAAEVFKELSNDMIVSDLIPEEKKPIMLISTPSKKKGFFYDCAITDPVFGAVAWNNLNLEANLFAELPKTAWDYARGIYNNKKQTLNFK